MSERALDFIVGCTGSGKTTAARYCIDTSGPPIVLGVDSLGGTRQSLATQLNARLYRRAEELRKRIYQDWPQVCAFVVPREGEEEEEAAKVAQLAWWLGTHGCDCWFVLEEAADCAPHPCRPIFRRIGKKGRHFGVSMLGASQRVVDIDPHLRAEMRAGQTWWFHLEEDGDLKCAPRWLRDRIRSLPKLHAIRVRPNEPAELVKLSPSSNGVDLVVLERVSVDGGPARAAVDARPPGPPASASGATPRAAPGSRREPTRGPPGSDEAEGSPDPSPGGDA